MNKQVYIVADNKQNATLKSNLCLLISVIYIFYLLISLYHNKENKSRKYPQLSQTHHARFAPARTTF